MHPILILLVGMVTVIGLIVWLRLNAFLALISAAILVSFLAPGDLATSVGRVAEAFGATAGSIGIVIALAAIIGRAMMDSGAADRVVRMFVSSLGEERAPTALAASGFVLAVPVFFDTVFFLLIPLARSLFRRTNRHYLRYLMAVTAGAAVTHTLVPPTPGPLLIAANLGVDLGLMIAMGVVVALPSLAAGLLFAGWIDRRLPVPLRLDASGVPGAESDPAPRLPGLLLSLLPILLPVLLISVSTVIGTLAAADREGGWAALAGYASFLGNPNLALLLAAGIALWVYQRQRRPTATELAGTVEEALMSAGVIILITAAGGAFGAMLRAAGIGPAIEGVLSGNSRAPDMLLLVLGFAIASLLKIAQGSSTVAMITASAMLAALITGTADLAFHPVYLATAIASGSLVGSWMNDSGFWLYTKMGGLTTVEALRSWTPLLAILGAVGMATTVLLALFLPMV